jgi:hypothetical protein
VPFKIQKINDNIHFKNIRLMHPAAKNVSSIYIKKTSKKLSSKNISKNQSKIFISQKRKKSCWFVKKIEGI